MEAPGEYLELRPQDAASVLPGYAMGAGEDAVVLLAQVTGGSCAWLGYAEWLADNDVRVIAIDVCGQGGAECSDDFAARPADQVDLAVRSLRDDGAERVTLVGSSMGASIAQGVAVSVGADAVVAVSPPPEWEGVDDVETVAEEINVPWLLVAAKGDDIDPPRLEKARESSPVPGGYREVSGSAHGYALITDGMLVDPQVEPLGRNILEWIRGDRPE